GLAFVSLLAAAASLALDWKLFVPVAAAGLMWGHYWAASNGLTIASMVAPIRYKGTATGFAYIFVKLAVFVTMLLFPVLFDREQGVGVPLATVIVSLISLAGFLAARYLLPEVYGYVEQERAVGGARSGALRSVGGGRSGGGDAVERT